MKIDDIDWAPFCFWTSSVPEGSPKNLVMSSDEHKFLKTILGLNTWYDTGSPAQRYINKLTIYRERFGQHMPIPIRKELLRSMAG